LSVSEISGRHHDLEAELVRLLDAFEDAFSGAGAESERAAGQPQNAAALQPRTTARAAGALPDRSGLRILDPVVRAAVLPGENESSWSMALPELPAPIPRI